MYVTAYIYLLKVSYARHKLFWELRPKTEGKLPTKHCAGCGGKKSLSLPPQEPYKAPEWWVHLGTGRPWKVPTMTPEKSIQVAGWCPQWSHRGPHSQDLPSRGTGSTLWTPRATLLLTGPEMVPSSWASQACRNQPQCPGPQPCLAFPCAPGRVLPESPSEKGQ